MDERLTRWQPVLKSYSTWLIACLLLFLLDGIPLFKPVRGVVEGGLWWVSEKTAAAGRVANQPLAALWYWRQGTQRLADLERRLADMAVDRAHLFQLEEENEALRELAKAETGRVTPPFMLARVVAGVDSILINVGAVEGAREGMIVVDQRGVLVGKLTAISSHTSLVSRPFDVGGKVAVRVVGRQTKGIVTGEGGGAQLTDVLQTDDLQVGDVLITSGADGVFPEGLVVGQVLELTGKAADVTKGGRVEVLFQNDAVVFVQE